MHTSSHDLFRDIEPSELQPLDRARIWTDMQGSRIIVKVNLTHYDETQEELSVDLHQFTKYKEVPMSMKNWTIRLHRWRMEQNLYLKSKDKKRCKVQKLVKYISILVENTDRSIQWTNKV